MTSNPVLGGERAYRGYRIIKVPSWHTHSGYAYAIHDYAHNFVAGQFGSQADAKRYIDQLYEGKNPRARRPVRGTARRKADIGLALVRMGIIPKAPKASRMPVLRAPIILVPPMTTRERKETAKQYGLDVSHVRSVSQMIPRWQRSGQRILNDLAKQDGIDSPKLDISVNAGTWVNGLSPGYHMQRKPRSIVAIDHTAAVSGMLEGGRCPVHLDTLLHEYRHHWQNRKLGEKKVQEAYEKEGSVGWKKHSMERDADRFARRECYNWSWRWDE